MAENFNRSVGLIVLVQCVTVIFGFLFSWLMLKGISPADTSASAALTRFIFRFGLLFLAVPLLWGLCALALHTWEKCPKKADSLILGTGIFIGVVFIIFIFRVFIGAIFSAGTVPQLELPE